MFLPEPIANDLATADDTNGAADFDAYAFNFLVAHGAAECRPVRGTKLAANARARHARLQFSRPLGGGRCLLGVRGIVVEPKLVDRELCSQSGRRCRVDESSERCCHLPPR